MYAGIVSALICVYFKKKSRVVELDLVDELIDAADHGYVIFCGDQTFLKANRQAEKQLESILHADLSGLTKNDFINCMYDHAEDIDEGMKALIQFEFSSENVPAFREVIALKDERLCLVNARELQYGKTLFTLVDISAERQREETLKRLNTINNHLVQAIQSTTTGIAISDPKQKGNPIIFVNDAFCVFADNKAEELLGNKWGHLISLIIDRPGQKKFLNALENYQETEIELEIRNDDERQYYSMSMAPIYDQDEVLDLFICLTYDVTLLKRREAEFFHSQKLKSLGQLAAGIAHDFNNVLSIISGYAEMASRNPDADKIQGYLQKIDAASTKGAALTHKMLTFSRHKIVSKECVDVREVIEEQAALLVPLLGQTISMNISMPDEPMRIMGDSSSIGQIIMNLSINARDAMVDGGSLDITLEACTHEDLLQHLRENVRESEEFLIISVEDTGIGMDKETVERIFDPFFSTKEQGKGTGLGLSVVYGLVNELGGILDVATEPGKGTTIKVYLPRTYHVPDEDQQGETGTDLNMDCSGLTVLIVEDEPDLLEVVTNMSNELGMTVLSAGNGDRALLIMDEYEGDIDVLVTDIVMPGMNGVKLAELVTSMNDEIKVVYMSGYPADGNMAPVEIPQDAIFLAKPIRYDDFLNGLRSALNGDAPNEQSSAYWKETVIKSGDGGTV